MGVSWGEFLVESVHRASAFGPATVANVKAGFDVLGYAIEGLGDRVEVVREEGDAEVVVDEITGTVTDLPRDPERNTASAALLALQRDSGVRCRLRIRIRKGIPLGSGLGGSAASAVAAVVAGARVLGLDRDAGELLPYCLEGEKAASGAPHADNAAPCLYGGLTALVSEHPPRVVRLPPPPVHTFVVHPHVVVETRRARAAMPEQVPLSAAVAQTVSVAGFLAGCYRGDPSLVRSAMVDRFAEPARGPMIPRFAEAAAAAGDAFAFGISGSGPSVFGWAEDRVSARRIGEAVREIWAGEEGGAELWLSPIAPEGARVFE